MGVLCCLGLQLLTLWTTACFQQASTAAVLWHLQNTIGRHALVHDLLHHTAYLEHAYRPDAGSCCCICYHSSCTEHCEAASPQHNQLCYAMLLKQSLALLRAVLH